MYWKTFIPLAEALLLHLFCNIYHATQQFVQQLKTEERMLHLYLIIGVCFCFKLHTSVIINRIEKTAWFQLN